MKYKYLYRDNAKNERELGQVVQVTLELMIKQKNSPPARLQLLDKYSAYHSFYPKSF